MPSTTLKKRDKIQFEQRMYKKAVDTARALLKENMSVEKISSITGLSFEEIWKMKS